jgi:hypothetical protein
MSFPAAWIAVAAALALFFAGPLQRLGTPTFA